MEAREAEINSSKEKGEGGGVRVDAVGPSSGAGLWRCGRATRTGDQGVLSPRWGDLELSFDRWVPSGPPFAGLCTSFPPSTS